MGEGDEIAGYDWSTTFEDLLYKAKKRGGNEKEFSTCRKCLEALPNFNQKSMIAQGKNYGITVIFVPCEDHDGITE